MVAHGEREEYMDVQDEGDGVFGVVVVYAAPLLPRAYPARPHLNLPLKGGGEEGAFPLRCAKGRGHLAQSGRRMIRLTDFPNSSSSAISINTDTQPLALVT